MKKIILIIILTGLITLIACTSQSDDPLTGTVWEWVSVTQKSSGTVTTVPEAEKYTITFNEDGTFEGQADCNAISGTYSQESGFTITLGPSTLAYCGEDSIDQQYLSLLSMVAAGGPNGSGGLALETAGGADRMEFQDGGPAR